MSIEKQDETRSGRHGPRTLDEAELHRAAGGPMGPPWLEALSGGELRQVAGGPTGPPWVPAGPLR